MKDNSKRYSVVLSVVIICAVFSFCYCVNLQPQTGSSVVATVPTPYVYPTETAPFTTIDNEQNKRGVPYDTSPTPMPSNVAWQIICKNCSSTLFYHPDGVTVSQIELWKCNICGFLGHPNEYDVSYRTP